MFGKLSEMLWICVYCCEDMRRSFKKCVLAIEKNCNQLPVGADCSSAFGGSDESINI